jgi:DNA repair exonuclease SbcCD ATPase subunit
MEDIKKVEQAEQEVSPLNLDDTALDSALMDEGEPETVKVEETEVIETKAEEVKAEDVKTEQVETKEADVDDGKARLEKQVKDKEEFIQRQAQEIGQLRKVLEDIQRNIPQNPDEQAYYENPQMAVEQVIRQREMLAYQARVQEQLAEKENETTIKTQVPDIESMIDDIAALALKDGAAPEIVRQFKSRPYAAIPDLVVQLANRVKAERRISELEKELNTLRKKPEDVLRRVEEAAKGPRTLTASTGISGAPSTVDVPVHKLSDKALDELLNS